MDEINELAQMNEYAQILYDYLHARTAESKVTGRKKLVLTPPNGLTKDALDALLPGIGTAEAAPVLANIQAVAGKKDTYLYDGEIMTKHYAELDALLEDKDILRTIATVTRSDSKLYPRPTQFSKLMNTPFRFSEDEILGAVARMKGEEEYQDIGMVTASNGKRALFSSQHLSERYARSLIEAIEVEAYENP